MYKFLLSVLALFHIITEFLGYSHIAYKTRSYCLWLNALDSELLHAALGKSMACRRCVRNSIEFLRALSPNETRGAGCGLSPPTLYG